jgi:hypothetical protein
MSNLANLLLDGLKIHPVTKHTVELFLEARPLTPACAVDFGVDTIDHYYALCNIFRGEVAVEAGQGNKSAIEELRKRVIELDQAYGNGSMLNALVAKYSSEFAEVVSFHTSWDEIFGRTKEKTPMKR